MVDTITTEFVLIDAASRVADTIKGSLRGLREEGRGLLTEEEKRDRRAARAIKNFETLERQQDALARATQRLASDLSKIDFARNTGGLGRTEEGLQRVARATQLANERFDRQRRELEGNITAYERLRNSLDPIARAQREFAAGQEVISNALASGEISIDRNAAELERLRAALDDQRRAAAFAADDYAQLQARLDPATAAQREFNIAASTVGDALARGRISVQQASEDFERLRRELNEAQSAVASQRTAFDQLEASLDPLVAANQRFEDGIRQVNTAVAAGQASDERAAAVKQRLTDQLREAERAAAENVSAFQRLRNEIDPLARAEQELAQRIRIVEQAVESGQASETEAAQVKTVLRQRVEDLRASIEQQGTAYRRLADSIDPVSAAQRQLDRDLQTVQGALRSGEIELEDYDAAVLRLERRFDDFRRQSEQTVNSFQRIRNSVDPASRALDEFTRDSNEVARALERQETSAEEAARVMRLLEERYRRAGQAADVADNNFGNLGRGVGRLNLAFSAGAGLITAFAGSLVVREILEFNDILQQSENRLRIVTDSLGELSATQDALFDSSQRSFTAILGGVEIYERLARSTKNLEISNDRLLIVTEAIQKSVALSGTTTLAANAALIQFGQGLAANSLRGQELNSVMEQTPRLARALAEGLGISIGELRALANQGELTSERVIKAIESQVDVINSEFATIEPTLAQVNTALQNTLTVLAGDFGAPILDAFKDTLADIQERLSDPETREAARAVGNDISISFEAAAGAINAAIDALARLTSEGSVARQRLADSIVDIEQDPNASLFDRAQVAFLLQADAGLRRFVELRREQLAVERDLAKAREEFNDQVRAEEVGAIFGLTASAARDAAVSVGLLADNTEKLDEEQAAAFAKVLADIGSGEGLEPLAEDLEKVSALLIEFGKIGPEALAKFNAAAGVSNVAFDKFVDQLEKQVGDLREKQRQDQLGSGAGIRELFAEEFPTPTPEQVAQVEALADEIDRLSVNTKKASDSFLQLALRQRQVGDLQIQLEAARGGQEQLDAAREEIALQQELLRLEADARKEGVGFNRAAEESRLRQIQLLEREIQIALEAYDEFQRRVDRIRDDVADTIGQDVDRIAGRASDDRRFASGNASQRDFALQQALEALNRRLEQFEEVDSLAFSTQEQIDAQRDVFREARQQIIDAYEEGGRVFEESLRAAAKELSATLLEDLIFNAGRGLGDILNAEIRRGVSDVFIDPLSDFLSGDSEDLFGDIIGGLEKVTGRFEKIGGSLDKIFGTGGTFAQFFGAAGAGFAGFGLGGGLADVFNGEQGETGSKIGGAAGGAIGFAVGGPIGAFIGSAAGGFLGDIFGGLFGRKTATGSVNFLTGETEFEDSKKDARNEERNTVLDQAVQAIEALAEALGANIRPGTGLEVNVGKRQIETDIIDPATGRVIRRAGTSDRGDINDAISDILAAALDAVLTGGDERLTRIAEAFADASVPAEQLLESLSSLSSVFDFIEEPASQFSQILDEVADVFEDASAVAGQYAAAQREIAQAQLETLEALAGRFDQDTEEATRRLTDPLLQDALDLAEEQVRRLEDAQRLNDEILAAIAALNAAPAAGASPTTGIGGAFGRGGRTLEDLLGADARRFLEQTAPPAGAGTTVDAAAAQAEAQERLRRVIELNTQELIAFVRNAGDTPDAFRAVTAAIDELRENAQELGIDFEDLDEVLEDLRDGFAQEFDQSERRRRLSIENPLALQAEELIDAQVSIIAAANAIGGTQEELSARLARTFEINALEIERFIESAASTPDAIAEIVAALETLRDRADEVGLTVDQVDQLSAGAIAGAGDGFLENINRSFLELTNEPLSRFTTLLENQQRLVETAQRFAQLQPDRFGGLPTIVQNLNALERQRFLEGLSEEDRLELGAFIGLIEDYGGRIAVVTTELRDTLNTTVTEIEDEIGRLTDVVEDATSRADALLDARQGIEDRFFPGSPQEQLQSIESRLESAFLRAQAGDEDAFEDIADLAARFVEQSAQVEGANPEFIRDRDRALEILTQAEALERARAAEAQSQIDILEADLEVSRNILKSLESAQDNTLFLQHIVENGLLQNQLLNQQIEELIRLRALQSGVDVSRVDALGSIDSAQSILSNFRAATAAPTPAQDQIEALLRSATLSAIPSFSFAQSSVDVASQLAELLTIARTSQPELDPQASVSPTPAQQVQSTQAAQSTGQTEVILAIGALEQTIATAFSRLIDAINNQSDEIRILRADNQRLNNDLKAAFRLALIENT